MGAVRQRAYLTARQWRRAAICARRPQRRGGSDRRLPSGAVIDLSSGQAVAVGLKRRVDRTPLCRTVRDHNEPVQRTRPGPHAQARSPRRVPVDGDDVFPGDLRRPKDRESTQQAEHPRRSQLDEVIRDDNRDTERSAQSAEPEARVESVVHNRVSLAAVARCRPGAARRVATRRAVTASRSGSQPRSRGPPPDQTSQSRCVLKRSSQRRWRTLVRVSSSRGSVEAWC